MKRIIYLLAVSCFLLISCHDDDRWVHYFVALVRESKGDHRGGGADGQGVWWQSLRVADG